MQYLLRVAIEDTPLWRLIAIEGKADVAHVAKLIGLAFNYGKSVYQFEIRDKTYSAGTDGQSDSLDELKQFDSFSIKEGDEFYFYNKSCGLKHKVTAMKVTDKLYCLIPSCLVGAGSIPLEEKLTTSSIKAYYDQDECPSLNLKETTQRLREYGSVRKNMDSALSEAGSIPFNIKE